VRISLIFEVNAMKKNGKLPVRRSLAAAIIITAVLLFPGCATRIGFEVIKPAEVNLADFTHLAVFDIEPYSYSMIDFTGKIVIDLFFGEEAGGFTGFYLYINEDLSNEFERQLVRSLQRTDYLTVLSPAQLRPYQGTGKTGAYLKEIINSDDSVAAALVGKIELFRFNEEIEERAVEQDGEQAVEQVFVQDLTLGFSYSVIDTRNGTVIHSRYIEKGMTRRTPVIDEQSFRAPTLFVPAQQIIGEIADEVRQQLIPQTVREVRFLMKDRQGDARMEQADEYVKRERYRDALDIYLSLWNSEENYAAAYNASVIYEALGRLEQAIELMSEVSRITAAPSASVRLEELYEAFDRYSEAERQMRN
jgi:hypothetical protein